jgi:hypothetical protein
MPSQFTHRHGAVSSHTSICLSCYRVVATRERESELRADEAIHSCKISLPGAKPDPTYWGILCRTCAELVAFSTTSSHNSGLGAENSPAGTIRCSKDHNRIYFPRDFRLYPSAAAIAEETMQKNFETYKAINPFWESSPDTLPTELPISKEKSESDIHAEALNGVKVRPASLLPDPRREIAQNAAKIRWASWALKKTQRLQ